MSKEIKGIFNENPGNRPQLVKDKSNKNHYKGVFDKSFITENEDIVEITHPDLGCLAYLSWVGQDENGIMICQPAIRSLSVEEDLYLSYDGEIMHHYDTPTAENPDKKTLLKEDVFMPNDGSVYKMEPNRMHYFNNLDFLSPNLYHGINVNNASVLMKNVSICNKGFDQGCMFTFRASFEGSISSEEIGGKVIILCTIDIISDLLPQR